MNPEQWLSLKWNGGSTMSDRWLNQSKIIHWYKPLQSASMIIALNKMLTSHVFPTQAKTCHIHLPPFRALQHTLILYRLPGPVPLHLPRQFRKIRVLFSV